MLLARVHACTCESACDVLTCTSNSSLHVIVCIVHILRHVHYTCRCVSVCMAVYVDDLWVMCYWLGPLAHGHACFGVLWIPIWPRILYRHAYRACLLHTHQHILDCMPAWSVLFWPRFVAFTPTWLCKLIANFRTDAKSSPASSGQSEAAPMDRICASTKATKKILRILPSRDFAIFCRLVERPSKALKGTLSTDPCICLLREGLWEFVIGVSFYFFLLSSQCGDRSAYMHVQKKEIFPIPKPNN